MSSHSWETGDAVAPAEASQSASHSWEDASAPSGSDDEDFVPTTPGQELVDHATGLYLMRSMSAHDFCVMMYWSAAAGVKEAAPYGYKPGAPPGHHQRHLKGAFPFLQDESHLYQMKVPCYNNADFGRATHDLFAVPPHEIIDRAMCSDATLRTRLDELVDSRQLPPASFSNPVTQQSELPVVPISIFIDGVPYSNSDSVIGFWAINEVSQDRHLLIALRKQLCCQCGCRGNCTFFTVFSFLEWSFRCLAEGRYPECRHDSSPWQPRDESRAERSGQTLKYRACLMYIKGDWAEYATTLGLPTWQDGLRPCFACNSSLDQLYTTDDISPVSLPWHANEDHEYYAACRRCEFHVVLDASSCKSVVDALEYDKRSHGNRGRCLREALPHLGLIVGDRLEPSKYLPDTSDIDSAVFFPMPVLFWRPGSETLCRFRSPLMAQDLGITPSRSLTIDTLHCLYLGVMLAFSRYVVWLMITEHVWGLAGTAEETLQISILAIRHELSQFYKARHREYPTEFLTRVRIGKKTFGDHGNRKLATKGAETWGFLLYLIDKLSKSKFRGDLLDAGRSVERIISIWNAGAVNLSVGETQGMFDAWNRFLMLTQGIDELELPKRHLFVHMLARAKHFGNPKLYANWLDESLNRQLKLACRTVSQATFEQFLLLRMQELLPKVGIKRKTCG